MQWIFLKESNMVRKVKDIILIDEDAKSTKKYLLCIDKIIDDEIDKKNTLSGVLSRDDEKVIDMGSSFINFIFVRN